MNSAFHLSYNMVLNLLRVEGISPEFMLERCFYTFQNDCNIPKYEQELLRLEDKKNSMIIENEAEIRQYYEIRQQIDIYAENIREVITHPTYCLPFLQPGRLLHIKHEDLDFGWGVLVTYRKAYERGKPRTDDNIYYILDVLLNCTKESEVSKDVSGKVIGFQPAKENNGGNLLVVPVLLKTIQGISHIRLKLPMDLKKRDNLQSVISSLKQVEKKFPNDTIPLLDPVENMNIQDPMFKKLVNKIIILEQQLKEHPLSESEHLTELYDKYKEKRDVINQIKAAKRKIADAQAIVQLDELKNRKRIMRR